MARKKKVVDASVLAKCFLSEPDSEKAVKLVRDHVTGKHLLIVPELVFFEVINAIKYRLKPSVGELAEAGRALARFQLHVEHAGEFLLAKIGEIAARYDITAYDAAYIALGEMHGIEVITADEKLLRKGIACAKSL